MYKFGNRQTNRKPENVMPACLAWQMHETTETLKAYLLISTVCENRLSFAHTDDIYSLMENIVTVAIPEINSSDDGFSATYPSLHRCTPFPSFVYGVKNRQYDTIQYGVFNVQ